MKKIGLVLAIAMVTGMGFAPTASAYHKSECHAHEHGGVTTWWGDCDGGDGIVGDLVPDGVVETDICDMIKGKMHDHPCNDTIP